MEADSYHQSLLGDREAVRPCCCLQPDRSDAQLHCSTMSDAQLQAVYSRVTSRFGRSAALPVLCRLTALVRHPVCPWQAAGTYREFVVYQKEQIYPEFIIFYSRLEA